VNPIQNRSDFPHLENKATVFYHDYIAYKAQVANVESRMLPKIICGTLYVYWFLLLLSSFPVSK
jgi:hypothetical protein